MLDVDNGQALSQLGEISNDGVGVGLFAFLPAPALRHPLTKQLCFADESWGAGTCVKSTINRRDSNGEITAALEKFAPIGDWLGRQFCLGEMLQEYFTAALTLGTEKNGSLMI